MTNKELQKILQKFPDDAEVLQETRSKDGYTFYIGVEPYSFEHVKDKNVYVGSGLKTKRMRNKILIHLGYWPAIAEDFAECL